MFKRTHFAFAIATALLLACPLYAADKPATKAKAETPMLNREEIIDHVKAVVKNLPYVTEGVAKQLHRADEGELLSDDALSILVAGVLKIATPKPTDSPETIEHRKALNIVQELLVKRLKSYRISGFSFAIDPNGAFFVDNQDPAFTVTYCNAKGEIKNRRYQASIDLIGLNIEFAIRCSLIFFTGTDADFYNTNKTIELGYGIELGGTLLIPALLHIIPENMLVTERHGQPAPTYFAVTAVILLALLRFTYIPFTNAPGGIVILGTTFGPLPGSGLSLVTGGTLTPVDN